MSAEEYEVQQALSHVDELAEQYRQARRDQQRVLGELKAALRSAGRLRIDGEALNRSELITRSGLSRRTAYEVFDADA